MRGVGRVAILAVSAALVLAPVDASALSPSTVTSTAQRNHVAYSWSYHTRGYYENNCLAFALGNTTAWIWPWGAANPTVSQVSSYLSRYLFSYVGPNAAGPLKTRRIYCYGSTSRVTHFARNTTATSSIRTDAIRAKWGGCEVFNHRHANPYTPTIYGPLVGAWVR
ncbi:MAG: DUF7689 domain-containing protein [Coriobacteriia bacterium]